MTKIGRLRQARLRQAQPPGFDTDEDCFASLAVTRIGRLRQAQPPGFDRLSQRAKIMVGLVIPLLLVAAMIEAWVTPRLALGLFR
ncbi:MAG: stage II sporulation protein M [Anaerolineaceae bacterium]|nr:stage II sporulation protein M [Anaerolineaceae bacterium]